MASGSFSPSESTSSSLLARARNGDPEAWRRLVALYGPLVFHWLRRWGVNESDAADISQEVFRSVARSIAKFRRESARDSFTGWLYTITANAVRKWWQKRQALPDSPGGTDFQQQLANLPTTEQAVPEDSVQETAELLLRRRALQLIREATDAVHWAAFEQTTLEGQTALEVAQNLGLTPAAVRQIKSRILRKLRETLEDLRPGE
jgi:RNA polymerase sigma-70 factor (ECF subfamily)